MYLRRCGEQYASTLHAGSSPRMRGAGVGSSRRWLQSSGRVRRVLRLPGPPGWDGPQNRLLRVRGLGDDSRPALIGRGAGPDPTPVRWAGRSAGAIIQGMGLSEWIGTGISLIGAGIAAWQARGAGKARTDARESSKKAADADERLAQATEELAELARMNAERKKPPWRIEHQSGDMYALINTSDDRMSNVNMCSLEDNEDFSEYFPIDIDGRSQHNFPYCNTLMTSPNRPVRVTWTWPDETEDKWNGEIPAKQR